MEKEERGNGMGKWRENVDKENGVGMYRETQRERIKK